MKNVNWKALILSLGISLGVGVLGSLITYNSMQQYEQLYRPSFAPPGWLFPVVWTILYIFMGVAAYLIYVTDGDSMQKEEALWLYGLQLLFNFGWSLLFFGLQSYVLAFVWLIVLWYLIYRTIQSFYEINPVAGILLIPYLLWVTFAGYLNLAIALYYRS